jgi:hypothetical protein
MQSFTFITLVLVFFFLVRQIRVFVAVATNSFAAGVFVADTVIVGLILFYFTYSLGVQPSSESRFDRVKLFLLAILALAFLQGIYVALTSDGHGKALLFRAFYSFREVFMPLSLLFLFSYLIKKEILRNGDLIFKRLSTLFTMFLWVAVAYSLLEFTLRAIVPQFNSFYLAEYIPYVSSPSESLMVPASDHLSAIVKQLTGLPVKRVYGIGLDLYLSGGIIFLCYLFHVFMSGKFRVLSILNCLVLVALLLSGSRTFIAPFLVLNAVIFARRYGMKSFLGPVLVGLVLAGGIILFVRIMSPTFAYHPGQGGGYFWLIGDAVDQVKQNLGLFIFGNGPKFIPLSSGDVMVGEIQSSLFGFVFDIGFLTLLLEIGAVMLALFVLFHIAVFMGNGNISGRRQPTDPYIKRLKIIIVLSIVVSLAHLPILFDRTIIVFHVLFVALLYSWSKYRMISYKAAPTVPMLAGLGPASAG